MAVTAAALVLAALGGAAALLAIHLVVLAVAARFHRGPEASEALAGNLVVVVPAHNEADLVGRCLDSLHAQDYPPGSYEVVVIADNCDDATADIATAAGATVMARDVADEIGKGFALRWAIDQLLETRRAMDAVVVVDADSIADPRLLAGLARATSSGAEVVQGEYLALADSGSRRARLRGAALLLVHRTRFAGRAALGLPCHLVGNGMLFSRRVLEAHPWTAFSSTEDLEYSVGLRLAGVRPVFAGDARLRAPMATGGRGARTQRLRWEGGRFHVARSLLPTVVRRIVTGDASLIDLAFELATPPLGLLAAGVAAGTASTAFLAARTGWPAWTALPWIAAAVALPLYVLVGLWAARAPRSTYAALLAAPALVAADLLTRSHLLRGSRSTTWERTARPSDTPPGRIDIGGVPIDPIGMDAAVQTVLGAVKRRRFMQICTVNLDFLVNARRSPDMRAVLRASQLNLADGAPVLWLSRLRGNPLPARVAGSDLVPRLLEAASGEGASVYFLGGEDGAASTAAAQSSARYPSLVVAGVHEPPRARLEDMDDDDIIGRIAAARPDILLVALGHPKQERWIDAHRDDLPVAVAVGVGCTFDLLAGRRGRAPGWMRAGGFEWLYRLLHEPRRLGARYARDAVSASRGAVPTEPPAASFEAADDVGADTCGGVVVRRGAMYLRYRPRGRPAAGEHVYKPHPVAACSGTTVM